MATHILSAEEQKHSLSGKKKFKKTTIRNVLGTPFANYWPTITPQDENEIVNVLKKHLKRLKSPKVTIPWNVMKTIPKDQRKAFRTAHIPSCSTDYRSHLVFGTNEVAKLLESNSASSVLVSSDADPKFLVKHIIDMCVLKEVPVLLIPNLKNLLKETTGLVSLTVAFKRNSKFGIVDEKINDLSKNYRPSINQVSSSCNRDEEEIQMDIANDDVSDGPQASCVYLYRKSKTERVFVPELSVKRELKGPFNQIDTDFVSLDDEPVDTSKSTEVKTNVKVSYKSLLLKRVTSNKNRDKKKIEKLKMKSK